MSAPPAVPPATTIRIGVNVHAAGMRGKTTALIVRSAGAEAGRAEHVWSQDEETWSASLDVVPSSTPPFVFTVEAGDARARIAIDASPRLRVLVYEARPSWASAFVRRALESDARFQVAAVSEAAPGAAISSSSGASNSAGPAGLRDPAFPNHIVDFDALVVGGLDGVGAAAVSRIEQFASDRGGAVLLLPDAPIPPTVARLLSGTTMHETLLERAAQLQTASPLAIEASELLEAENAGTETDVFARAPSSQRPVVWSRRFGDGVLAVSGAMDAWRYRGAADAAFDRFWRSVVSGLALAAHPPVAVTVSRNRAAAGERVQVSARVRALERNQLADRLAITAAVGDTPLRLWPDAGLGVFTGSVVVEGRESMIVTARVAGTSAEGRARVTIDEDARDRSAAPLALLAQSRGGVNATPADLGPVERHLRRTVKADPVRAPRHPMRSAWWFAPFAAALSAEWWLRRRRGAR